MIMNGPAPNVLIQALRKPSFGAGRRNVLSGAEEGIKEVATIDCRS